LVLIGVANGAALFGRTLLRDRFGARLDGGLNFFDGRPLLGPSKTIRGVVLALITTPAAAVLLGLDWPTGLTIAIFAMVGDVFSSFAKRRLGMPSSSQAFGLDQIPECLFPLLAVQAHLMLEIFEIIAVVVVFVVLELAVSRVLFKFRLRDQPY
jgi:CDP-2,3-bis-(O-geranylgeranyl)-sn-glycerol synthase